MSPTPIRLANISSHTILNNSLKIFHFYAYFILIYWSEKYLLNIIRFHRLEFVFSCVFTIFSNIYFLLEKFWYEIRTSGIYSQGILKKDINYLYVLFGIEKRRILPLLSASFSAMFCFFSFLKSQELDFEFLARYKKDIFKREAFPTENCLDYLFKPVHFISWEYSTERI